MTEKQSNKISFIKSIFSSKSSKCDRNNISLRRFSDKDKKLPVCKQLSSGTYESGVYEEINLEPEYDESLNSEGPSITPEKNEVLVNNEESEYEQNVD